MKVGLYPSMPDIEYFGKAEVTNSDFKLLGMSALHHKNKDLFKYESPVLDFGSALHCMVLEPDLFEDQFAVENFEGCDLNKNSKAYKEAKLEWLEKSEGKKIISKDDYEKLSRMTENVMTMYGDLLKDGDPEVAMFANINDVLVSGKADYINHKLGYIIDVKTTASIEKFGQSAVDYNYISQSAFYSDIFTAITGKRYKFAFVLVEKASPYRVDVVTAGSDMIEDGRSIYAEMLEKYVAFRDRGDLGEEKYVKLPNWYLKSRGFIEGGEV